MTPTRYSPKPIEAYGFSAGSRLLRDDTAAWNLAYLSWDMEASPMWPDAHFSTHVRRTLQFVIDDGTIDMAGLAHPNDVVRGYFLLPPPRAVYLLERMPLLTRLPMYLAYGQPWLDVARQRSRLWREPTDPRHDFMVAPTKETQALINSMK